MDFVTHDGAGNILRYGTCNPGDFALQAGSGESVIAATYQPGTVVNSVLVPLSPTALAAVQLAERNAMKAAFVASRRNSYNLP